MNICWFEYDGLYSAWKFVTKNNFIKLNRAYIAFEFIEVKRRSVYNKFMSKL